MIDYVLRSIPILIALIVYFVRLEVKLATIQRDMCWIKKRMEQCQQPSVEPTT